MDCRFVNVETFIFTWCPFQPDEVPLFALSLASLLQTSLLILPMENGYDPRRLSTLKKKRSEGALKTRGANKRNGGVSERPCLRRDGGKERSREAERRGEMGGPLSQPTPQGFF